MLDTSGLIKNHKVFSHNRDVIFRGDITKEKIIILLSGEVTQTLKKSKIRRLIIKHKDISYIGLEELIKNCPHEQVIRIKAGSKYILYTLEEFLLVFQMQLNITFHSIIYLSKQLRTHYTKGKKINFTPQFPTILDDINPDEDLEETLYNISFSNEDNIPQDIAEKILITFPPNHTIMEEGDHSNELYILVDGQVSIYQKIKKEQKKIAELQATSLIGEMAQFDGLPRSATVITDTTAKLLVFKPENFKMVFQLHPKWSLKIINSLAERIISIRTNLLEHGIY